MVKRETLERRIKLYEARIAELRVLLEDPSVNLPIHGRVLEAWLDENGISKAEAAVRIGVTRSAVYKYCSTDLFSEATISKLSKAVGCPPSLFI